MTNSDLTLRTINRIVISGGTYRPNSAETRAARALGSASHASALSQAREFVILRATYRASQDDRGISGARRLAHEASKLFGSRRVALTMTNIVDFPRCGGCAYTESAETGYCVYCGGKLSDHVRANSIESDDLAAQDTQETEAAEYAAYIAQRFNLAYILANADSVAVAFAAVDPIEYPRMRSERESAFVAATGHTIAAHIETDALRRIAAAIVACAALVIANG